MDTLRISKDLIFDVKNQVETNSRGIYTHITLNDRACDEDTVSIVMTSSNRSTQVYFTLQTIQLSEYKNIQVILVDDSTSDPVLEEHLTRFPFTLDFIKINRDKKCWHNPLVNYNIGFKFVRGSRIIIQNGEVCHVGDVISHLVTNLMPNTYSAYDVRAMPSYEANRFIYDQDLLEIAILQNAQVGIWYQGRLRNCSFHFLAGFDRTCLDKIKGFSYDYTFGSSYDDNDFVLRMSSNGIDIKPFFSDIAKCAGIHLFHGSSRTSWDRSVECNKTLFIRKMRYFNTHKIYVEVSSDADGFESRFSLLN